MVRVGGGVAGRLLRYLQVAVEVLELPNSCVEHPHRGYTAVHFYFTLSSLSCGNRHNIVQTYLSVLTK